jgi:hypothetical protein
MVRLTIGAQYGDSASDEKVHVLKKLCQMYLLKKCEVNTSGQSKK